MKTLITVIWGTEVDTNFWKIFLKNLWYKGITWFAITKTPEEQNRLQYKFPEILFEKCLSICKDAKINWYEKVLIYCNSLTSVLDIKNYKEKVI